MPFDSAPSTLLYTKLCISHHHMVVDMLIRPPTEDSRKMHLCFRWEPGIIGLLERLIFTAAAIVTASRASASTQFREITLLFGYRDIFPSGSVGDMSHVHQMNGPPRHGPGDLFVTLEKRAGFTTDYTSTKRMRSGYLERQGMYTDDIMMKVDSRSVWLFFFPAVSSQLPFPSLPTFSQPSSSIHVQADRYSMSTFLIST